METGEPHHLVNSASYGILKAASAAGTMIPIITIEKGEVLKPSPFSTYAPLMQMLVSGYSVSLLRSQPIRHKPMLPKTIAPGAGITGSGSPFLTAHSSNPALFGQFSPNFEKK